jgi:hypothetical protein
MLVFVHIEKTAGTSLKFVLRNSFGQRHCDSFKNKKKIFTQTDLDYAKKVFGSIKCISGHNLVEPTKHLNEDGLMFLTFLREPVTRSASFYQDHCLRSGYKTSFEKWMGDENKHNMQTKRIAGNDDVEKAKRILKNNYFFVGLTEQFEESLKLLSIVCPEKLNLKYKKKLISQDNTIKNELINNSETLQILKDANTLDAELYDYVKNELFAERMHKYQKELNEAVLPKSYYKNHCTYNYQMSIAFNKYIYRQLLKMKKGSTK